MKKKQKMFLPPIKKVLKNRWFFRLIGIGIFILVLYQINWFEFLRMIKQLNPYWILLSMILQGVALLVTTFRWHLIMKTLNIHVSYGLSLAHQLIGTGVAIVTPGQLGEFIKVLYHRGLKFPVPESALSVLIDRLYDLAILIAFGFFSLVVLFDVRSEILMGFSVVASLLAIASIFYFRTKTNSIDWIAYFIARFSPKPYKNIVKQNIRRLIKEVGSNSPVLIVICVLLSLINYALLVFKVYMLALAVHIRIPFWYFASAVPIFRLAGLIPISVSGIGTRDAMIIYLLSRAGVNTESSLIFSLLGLVTLEFQALIGMLLWWRYPPTIESGIEFPERAFSGIEEVIPEG